ncbi:hypothetical protein DFA_09399 [Cavenderia fasciculata]|uniref:Uncharacterized protein n=1 Tax=Cavenderia fasciculata TaxID=261658 RepID=F4Q7I6_CACFS|nr:uncharacterized protein DFA_09399 [Cavenderia fasciculata]EGG16368.1 hypothetical protein DFA_09399 [Cavenderia fasciculata]|eukprot:XP_004354752.1 hypothetical protein DFA_09399 [Cavenderia fasciculata]
MISSSLSSSSSCNHNDDNSSRLVQIRLVWVLSNQYLRTKIFEYVRWIHRGFEIDRSASRHKEENIKKYYYFCNPKSNAQLESGGQSLTEMLCYGRGDLFIKYLPKYLEIVPKDEARKAMHHFWQLAIARVASVTVLRCIMTSELIYLDTHQSLRTLSQCVHRYYKKVPNKDFQSTPMHWYINNQYLIKLLFKFSTKLLNHQIIIDFINQQEKQEKQQQQPSTTSSSTSSSSSSLKLIQIFEKYNIINIKWKDVWFNAVTVKDYQVLDYATDRLKSATVITAKMVNYIIKYGDLQLLKRLLLKYTLTKDQNTIHTILHSKLASQHAKEYIDTLFALNHPRLAQNNCFGNHIRSIDYKILTTDLLDLVLNPYPDPTDLWAHVNVGLVRSFARSSIELLEYYLDLTKDKYVDHDWSQLLNETLKYGNEEMFGWVLTHHNAYPFKIEYIPSGAHNDCDDQVVAKYMKMVWSVFEKASNLQFDTIDICPFLSHPHPIMWQILDILGTFFNKTTHSYFNGYRILEAAALHSLEIYQKTTNLFANQSRLIRPNCLIAKSIANGNQAQLLEMIWHSNESHWEEIIKLCFQLALDKLDRINRQIIRHYYEPAAQVQLKQALCERKATMTLFPVIFNHLVPGKEVCRFIHIPYTIEVESVENLFNDPSENDKSFWSMFIEYLDKSASFFTFDHMVPELVHLIDMSRKLGHIKMINLLSVAQLRILTLNKNNKT